MRIVRLLILLTLPLLAACASGSKAAFKPGVIVWPSAPLPPRLALTAVLTTPEDAGIRKGFWGTVWSTLVGEEEISLARPYGVHADSQQRLMIVDSAKKGIHLFDRKEGRYTFINGGEEVTFVSPIAVTEDASNRLYVTDSASAAVYRCTLDTLRVEPFVTTGLKRPTGIAYNPQNGLIYVVDTVASQVVAYDQSGREVLRFGEKGGNPGRFNRPTDLAVDARGRILVTDPLNWRIQIFSRDGVYLKGFGEAGDSSGHFAKPKGVAVDSEGHIYVCDALFDTVQVFNEEGVLLMSFGNLGSAPGEFWMPSGIYIDDNDLVYVTDTYNRRVQVFSYISQGGEDR